MKNGTVITPLSEAAYASKSYSTILRFSSHLQHNKPIPYEWLLGRRRRCAARRGRVARQWWRENTISNLMQRHSVGNDSSFVYVRSFTFSFVFLVVMLVFFLQGSLKCIFIVWRGTIIEVILVGDALARLNLTLHQRWVFCPSRYRFQSRLSWTLRMIMDF